MSLMDKITKVATTIEAVSKSIEAADRAIKVVKEVTKPKTQPRREE
jgi:hypothetical protein